MGNKYNVKRSLASEKQLSSVVKLSEQKNDSRRHYEIVASMFSLTAGDASYELNRFAMDKNFVPRKVFEVNQKITEDPEWYLENVLKDSEFQKQALYEHKLRLYTIGKIENDIPTMAIQYIELENNQEFIELIKDDDPKWIEKIKSYISNLKILNIPDHSEAREIFNKIQM